MSEMSERVSTLVFLDLEATGLPSEIGRRNVHITEMALVAVDRMEFESDATLRVYNKLSLCFRPRAPVSPPAMHITGLYNDSLENQSQFDESVPKLFEHFFRRLRRPICLLAHNGKRYDFPLLQAELKNICYGLDPEILCADTLEAFRAISPKLTAASTFHGRTPSPRSQVSKITNDDDEIDRLLSEDLDLFASVAEPQVSSGSDLSSSKWNPLDDERTPPKPKNQNASFSYPDKRASAFNPSNKVKFLYPDKRARMEPVIARTNPPHAKRKLFEDSHSKNVALLQSNSNLPDGIQPPNGVSNGVKCLNSKSIGVQPLNATSPVLNGVKSLTAGTYAENGVKPLKITRFSLEKLYELFFGELPPVSHFAEADCIALSKLCQKVHSEMLPWLDENSVSFSKVREMW